MLSPVSLRRDTGTNGVRWANNLRFPYVRSISMNHSQKGFGRPHMRKIEHTRILEAHEEAELGSVGRKADEEHGVAANDERQAIVAGVPWKPRQSRGL